MGHYIQSDLKSQQKKLASQDYDLRVSNLALFILKKLPSSKASLIDIGAGNGLVLRIFKQKGFLVSGMELSPALCEAMTKNPRMRGIDIFQGDISQKKGNEQYDIVLASDVIEHISNDQLALKNLFSFLRPGGVLVVTVPAHSHLFGKRDKLWGHFRRYDKTYLTKQLSTLLGKIEFVSYWNFVGYFAYFFYEKILGKAVKENFRYSSSLSSRLFRGFLDFILRLEAFVGYVPWGLTLVAIVRKNK
jgi:SAM-dependent methyltransferase